jgi:predicted alpha/beta hydrolase family esterase
MVSPNVLIVPGLGGSGPDHWQTRWELEHGYSRVEQRDWDQPVVAEWLAGMDRALSERNHPCLIVAHSLGCALVAHHAKCSGPMVSRICGALLVAPADVEDPTRTPDVTRCFAPLPRQRLPYPAIVVASTDDPYADPERARQFAAQWGAQFENIGPAGHINAESNLGSWARGHRFLAELLGRL